MSETGERDRVQGLAAKIQEAAQFIRSRWATKPRVGLILGTGLGGLASQISEAVKILEKLSAELSEELQENS